ncbi:sigma-54-dependent transcriptional regulator [Roseinatronobacter alkalisoli]|uniref:Sigma-54 dependent transcriptional regulator n=1 Tax=Roseinatronobacter alkalisoli TaxID=3028235 RepID=A0ABT5T846_9RHOB|nr:sigma-54 dependent transcriptional regulator [Roseinatronobacter sp. HJB301]MDD7971244.1 sigma-54 dependent transcriptional regulator [Roseinatronobacter sp. HJB301]
MSDILIVDDERDIRELISDILKDEGYVTRLAANSDQAMAEVNAKAPALIILDIWLKDSKMDGIDILMKVKRSNPDIPIVIISGHGNVEIAVAAIKQGAYDFIEKPFNIDKLMVVINRAMEASRLRRENQDLRRRDNHSSELIGESHAFRNLCAQLEKVTHSNARIMFTGPAGSGKEAAARFVHENSDRASRPFVCVSSAAIEPERMEEVLFGRESADRGVEPGLLEQAHGGVVFFDEVADMPLGTQSKILRVLVDQQFMRLGGADKVRVDMRVMSATTHDLAALIREGLFRQELLDRLSVVPVRVPGLDERREDIPLLASYFIDMLHKSQGLPRRILQDAAQAHLQTMHWPGNIRQLRNVVERALILGDASAPIGLADLQNDTHAPSAGSDDTAKIILSGALTTLPLRDARELFEREYLLSQIHRFGGNISRTASFVGMERSALHRKLKSLGVSTAKNAG